MWEGGQRKDYKEAGRNFGNDAYVHYLEWGGAFIIIHMHQKLRKFCNKLTQFMIWKYHIKLHSL